MRLLTREIHRAFVELDPYGDEQCWRFIRVAQGRWLAKTLMAAGALGAAVGMFIAGFAGWVAVLHGLRAYESDVVGGGWWRWPLAVLAGVPFMGLGPLSGYFARDRLLELRLRYVLRRRGRCPGCRYSLIGLSLTPRSTVFCPECGAECEVDPSLGELAREGALTGRVRRGEGFVRPSLVPAWFWWWLKVVGLVAGLVVFAVIPAILGVWEIGVRRDAARARAGVPRLLAAELALARESGLKPAGTAGGRPTTEAALGAVASVIQKTWSQWLDSHLDDDQPTADLTLLYETSSAAFPEMTAEQRQAGEVRARAFLRTMVEAGLEERFRVLADSVPEIPAAYEAALGSGKAAWVFQDDRWLIDLDSPEERFLRALAAERLRAGPDRAGVLRLIDLRLGIARALCASPAWPDKFAGLQSEFAAHLLIADLLATHPVGRQLSELSAILERRAFDSRMEDAERWARLRWGLEVSEWFMNVDETRWGAQSRLGDQIRRTTRTWPRMGGYSENLAVTETWGTPPAGFWAQDAFARTWSPGATSADPAVAWGIPGRNPLWTIGWSDRERAERRGVRLLLALERYRLNRGTYPASLDELGPAGAEIDPYSGRPFGYRLVEEKRGGFVLYSVGDDRRDDGGKAPLAPRTSSPWQWWVTPGTDMILNQSAGPEPGESALHSPRPGG